VRDYSETDLEFNICRWDRSRVGERVTPVGTHESDTALTATATTDDDIRQLRAALRGALGTAKDDAVPAPDPRWRAGWPALAELGVTAFCVPEDKGGFGLQSAVAVGAAQELGAALHGSPFAGLTAAAHVLAGAGRAEADDVLARVVEGATVCAFGLLDPTGERAWVVDGAPESDVMVLCDPTTGASTLLTDPSAWTIEVPVESFDVSRTSGAVTDVGAGVGLGAAPVAVDLYRLLLAADAAGCVQRMLYRTVAYAGQRMAFGRPIGGFQAVQHRLADHAVRARGMALVVAEAAALIDAGSDQASRQAALAAVSVHGNAVRILHDLVQLTGGLGFTWEYGLHFYERRAHQDARLAGGARAAVRSVVEIEGWS
jgi:alkylation response protein AidB-like acyl-CoA dehydrogenase